jgi:hypothetical protein
MTFQKLSSCNIIEVIVALVIRGYCCTNVILKLLSKAIVAQVSFDNDFQSFLHLRCARFHCCKKKRRVEQTDMDGPLTCSSLTLEQEF